MEKERVFRFAPLLPLSFWHQKENKTERRRKLATIKQSMDHLNVIVRTPHAHTQQQHSTLTTSSAFCLPFNRTLVSTNQRHKQTIPNRWKTPLAHSRNFFLPSLIFSTAGKTISKSNGGKRKRENPTPVRRNQNTSLYTFRRDAAGQGNLIWTDPASTEPNQEKDKKVNRNQNG